MLRSEENAELDEHLETILSRQYSKLITTLYTLKLKDEKLTHIHLENENHPEGCTEGE